MYNFVVYSTRVALLYMYIDIFCTGATTGRLREICLWAMGVLGAYYFGSFVVELNVCRPMQRVWDTGADGSCLQINHLILLSAVVNLAADIFIWVVPLTKIYHLQVDRRSKASLYGMFGIGLM